MTTTPPPPLLRVCKYVLTSADPWGTEGSCLLTVNARNFSECTTSTTEPAEHAQSLSLSSSSSSSSRKPKPMSMSMPCDSLKPIFADLLIPVTRILASAHDTPSPSVCVIVVCLWNGRVVVVGGSMEGQTGMMLAHVPTFAVTADMLTRLLHDVCMFVVTRAESMNACSVHFAGAVFPGGDGDVAYESGGGSNSGSSGSRNGSAHIVCASGKTLNTATALAASAQKTQTQTGTAGTQPTDIFKMSCGAVCTRSAHPVFQCAFAPRDMIPVVRVGGPVLGFIPVHPLYQAAYVRVTAASTTSTSTSTSTTLDMTFDASPFAPLVHILSVINTGSREIGGCGGIIGGGGGGGSSSNSTSSSPSFEHTGGPAVHVNVSNVGSNMGAGLDETLIPYTSPPSLFADVRAALLELARAADFNEVAGRLFSTGKMNKMTYVVVQKHSKLLQERLLSQQELEGRLATDWGTLGELPGLMFDLLLRQCALEDVAPEWNSSLLFERDDTGLLSVLFMLQWRSSVARFIDLARGAQIDGTAAVCAELERFRVGIMWQGTHMVTQVSTYRRMSCGTHIFFFNPSRETLTLKPVSGELFRTTTLALSEWAVVGAMQTQIAKARDTVVAFFMSQAVYLVSLALANGTTTTPSGGGLNSLERAPLIMATLLGMYEGQMHEYDLKHDYKNHQADVRQLRLLKPAAGRRGRT